MNSFKNIIWIVLLISISYSCSSVKKENPKDKRECVTIEMPIDGTNETKKTKELRFSSSKNAGVTQEFMRQKFGKPINEFQTNRSLPMQIWTNVRLFEETNELFTIGICGDYSKIPTIKLNNEQKYILINYNSVIAFDSKNEDCFKDNHKYKNMLENYFILNTNEFKNK